MDRQKIHTKGTLLYILGESAFSSDNERKHTASSLRKMAEILDKHDVAMGDIVRRLRSAANEAAIFEFTD